MNRRDRRAAGQRRHLPAGLDRPDLAEKFMAYRCPDCISEVRDPVLVDPRGRGLYRIDIAHDETCPTYRRLLGLGRLT